MVASTSKHNLGVLYINKCKRWDWKMKSVLSGLEEK